MEARAWTAVKKKGASRSLRSSFRKVAIWAGIGTSLWSAAAFADVSARDLIVRYRQPQNTDLQATITSLRASGQSARAEVVSGSQGLVKLRFDDAEQADLASAKLELSPEVESVAPNFLYRPSLRLKARRASPGAKRSVFLSLPFATAEFPEVQLPPPGGVAGEDPWVAKDWALASIRMPSASTLASWLPNAGMVTAAVVDTGIDYNHEDLSGALWRNPENEREIGYDFAHRSARPYDAVKFDIEGCMKDEACAMGIAQSRYLVNPGHGTHCAGHVGAVAGNSIGIQGIGQAKTRVMGLKFFYDEGDENAGQGDDAAAIQSIDYAIRHGAKVVNASWGGRLSRTEGNASELKAALERARQAGVIVVVAAGNDALDQDSASYPAYPAAYDLDNLIVVAATDKGDLLAEFSNYGAKSVHIAAPGVKILSTTVGSKYDDVVARFTDPRGEAQEMIWEGTSMAAPIVAGAVSLVWSKHPQADYREIRDRILKSARPVPALAGKVATGGVLDVTAALAL